MNYAAILFDMDGTLLETGECWDEPTRKAFAECGLALSDDDIQRLAGTALTHFLAGRGELHHLQQIREIRNRHMIPLVAERARWQLGALALIESLGESAQTGIVTSAPREIVNALDTSLGVRSWIHHIVTGDDVAPDYKPEPKGLLLACDYLGVQPAECVYVGDQENDLKAAANAGMDAILLRGMQTPAGVKHAKEARDFSALRHLLADRAT